ncbi:hypothetical protein GC163_14515 [bacterium]|nr:hypothetical protein [bacterium]
MSQETETTKSPSRRLPNNYAKLGLSDKQRSEIYKQQADYGERIDSLIRQVEMLRKERDDAIENVLTDEQKATLKNLLAETASKAKAKKSKAAGDAEPKAGE